MSEAEKKNTPDASGSDALAHWQAQENAGLHPEDPAPEDGHRDDWQMPAGWWLIPAATAGVPLWIALIRLIF